GRLHAPRSHWQMATTKIRHLPSAICHLPFAICRLPFSIFLLPFALFCAGCFTPASRITVEVTNLTSEPISAGFVKTGQKEDGWVAPSDVAIQAPQLSERRWGTLIKPAQTVVLGPQAGHFETGSLAWLRVYAGDHNIVELVAI